MELLLELVKYEVGRVKCNCRPKLTLDKSTCVDRACHFFSFWGDDSFVQYPGYGSLAHVPLVFQIRFGLLYCCCCCCCCCCCFCFCCCFGWCKCSFLLLGSNSNVGMFGSRQMPYQQWHVWWGENHQHDWKERNERCVCSWPSVMQSTNPWLLWYWQVV